MFKNKTDFFYCSPNDCCCTFINWVPLHGSVVSSQKDWTLKFRLCHASGVPDTAPIQPPPSHRTFARGSSCACTRLPIAATVALSALAQHHGIAQSLHARWMLRFPRSSPSTSSWRSHKMLLYSPGQGRPRLWQYLGAAWCSWFFWLLTTYSVTLQDLCGRLSFEFSLG